MTVAVREGGVDNRAVWRGGKRGGVESKHSAIIGGGAQFSDLPQLRRYCGGDSWHILRCFPHHAGFQKINNKNNTKIFVLLITILRYINKKWHPDNCQCIKWAFKLYMCICESQRKKNHSRDLAGGVGYDYCIKNSSLCRR